VRDDQGRVTAWFGSTTDIHDRRQAEDRQRRLTSELSHRVKNILSVVQVLASRSGAKAASVAECIEMFQGRLQALSAAQSALGAGQWNWASLAGLVQTTLGPYLAETDRIRLDVQDLRLDPEIALTLAIGLHELATNAAKYGALSSPTGRITLTGRVETGQDGDELHLLWQEDGGPEVEPPKAAGFGTTMLTQAMQYQHKGRAELDWRKEGLVCRIVLLLEPAAGTLDPPQ
jgi:two-component sensor histidine kinase